MMKKYLIPILIICCVLLTSCGVQRHATPKRYNTLSQKASTTLQFNQHSYTMGSTMQLWKNELIIISLQPLLGIEMVRIEATQDSVLIVDKMNRRYTTLAYNLFEKDVHPKPSFKLIQQFLTTPQNGKEKKQQRFDFGKHHISISCQFSQREYNALSNPKRINLKKYKQVTLRDILPL